MSEFLGYLQRLNVRPDPDDLTSAEWSYLQNRFEASAGEVNVEGQVIPWDYIDEVEVVKAARMRGASGWLVRQMMGEDRYHVGLYYGAHEAVLTNISLKQAQFVVQTVAFYAPHPVRYRGVEGLSPLSIS